MKEVTYIEIDIQYCALQYSVGACQASLGVTGSEKCFNTRNFTSDCQDPINYDEGGLTVRFGIDNGNLPFEIPCIPSLLSATMQEAEIEPGLSIGKRATLNCKFKNHPHGDAGLDKYISDRTYNPFLRGTFWGKFRARNPYLENQPIRLRRGYVGQELSEFRTDHFIIDKFMGPDAQGAVSITAYDPMRLLAGKSSQAPQVSEGYLSVDYPAGTTSIALDPDGIGATYPSSGKLSIGQELLSFTRSGDTISGFTTLEDHDAGDVAQVALEYDSETSAYIINDLTVSYTPLTSSYTNLPAWEALGAAYSDTRYSALIVKPTPVETLINELVEQAGLIVYGDTQANQMVYDVLRPTSKSGVGPSGRRIVLNTFKQMDQPDRRYSQVWVFYNQRDQFKNLDEPTNFYSAFVKAPGQNLYATQSIKKIFSRWIPRGGQSVASDIASRALSRYINPPRKFAFSLFAGNNFMPELGQTVPLTIATLEDCTGAQATVPVVITGVRVEGEGNVYSAEELIFDNSVVDLARVITIEFDSYNINLRELYDDIYSTISGSTPIVFRVVSGVVVGSQSNTQFSLDSGVWPSGIEPSLVIDPGAYVVGKGGDSAQDGGPAMKVRSPLAVTNSGIIGGGGGGGGNARVSDGRVYYGGGGAGRLGGTGPTFPPGAGFSGDGSLTFGGQAERENVGLRGGNGAGLGNTGAVAVSSGLLDLTYTVDPPGAPGVAVDGDSLISWVVEGDIRGAQIG